MPLLLARPLEISTVPERASRGGIRSRRGEKERGEAEGGDGGGAEIDGEAESSRGHHHAENDGHRAHREIGEEIEGGEHAAAMMRRGGAVDQPERAQEQKAVLCAGPRCDQPPAGRAPA